MSERVVVQPAGNPIRVTSGGSPVAESHTAHVVHETGLPPRYYFPKEHLKAQVEPGTGEGVCPWKGKWRHLDVIVGDQRIANGAWTYYETTPVCAVIKDAVAFYPEKVSIEIG
ncbi:MAG: DUF427 domain-containing protein [Polyangiaceae bacterium]|nr:DUF427 domain-containing protein [Polyangiaceae bacterium]